MMRQIDAQKLGNEMLQQHNLTNWEIQFNKSPRFLGQCWHEHKVIAISTVMLNSAEAAQVRDTLLHEIAHALVGPGHMHDETWKQKAKEIGCTAETCGRTGFNPVAARRIEPSEMMPRKVIPPLMKRCPRCSQPAEIQSRMTLPGNITFLKLKCSHMVKEQDLIGQSFDGWTSASGKKLFPYQKTGAEFILASGGRCLIADEPALGKTVQAMSPLKFYPELFLPCLWVTKSKLKVQAAKELIDWCGIEYFPCMIDSSKSFILEGFKIYVISMDLLKRMNTEKLDKIQFKTMIFDEIQHISNPNSARTQEVRRISQKVEHIIFLSGTPWKNRGTEYYPSLNMLSPERFQSEKQFEERWVEWYQTAEGKYKAGGIRNVPKFREYTKDFIIRRLRDDVLPDLPKINRQLSYVEVEDIYESAYEKAEKAFAEKVKDQILEGKENLGLLQDDIMILKHIVGLAKVDTQIEQAIEFLENSETWEKMTIFHHHIDVGDNLEKKLNEYLRANNYLSALRIRGGMDGFESNRVLTRFKMDEKARILIASTLASGEGLNIQFCQNASMMERQWNPANEEQAELRFSRPLTYGDMPSYLQDHFFDENHNPKKVSIRVPYLICANTVDETLTEIIERKRFHFTKSMDQGKENIEWDENEIMKELVAAIMKKRYPK